MTFFSDLMFTTAAVKKLYMTSGKRELIQDQDEELESAADLAEPQPVKIKSTCSTLCCLLCRSWFPCCCTVSKGRQRPTDDEILWLLNEKAGEKLESELDLVKILLKLRQVDAIVNYLTDKDSGDTGSTFKQH